MNLFELSATIRLDADSFNQKVAEAAKEIKEFHKAVEEAFDQSEAVNRAKKSLTEYRTDIGKAAATNRQAGMSASEAMKKAYADIDRSMYDLGKSARSTGKKIAGEGEETAENVKDSFEDVEDKAKDTGERVKDAWKNAFSVSMGHIIADFAKSSARFLADVAKESIGLASDLDEVQNVVDVTFGAGAGEIDRWAKSAKSAFGMSELGAKKYTGTIGAMLKSMGLSSSAVVDMSENIVGLAGDMASFYNLEHEEAFEKIRSGISGETEPLKQLGINMSVANLEAFAMSQGLAKAYSAMTQAEQATLRYNYLLSATADAQGDFSRTSGEYANAMRTFQLNLDEIKAGFGSGLLEAVEPAVSAVNEWYASVTQTEDDVIQQAMEDELAQADEKLASAGKLIDSLEKMQLDLGDAALETDDWNAALKALSQTMPELNGYIDLNSGRLSINTAELRKNAQAVRDTEVYSAKQRAISAYNTKASTAEAKAADKLVEVWMKQAEMPAVWDEYYAHIMRISEATGLATTEIGDMLSGSDKTRLKGKGASAEDVEKAAAIRSKNKRYIRDTENLMKAYEGLTEESAKAADEAERVSLVLSSNVVLTEEQSRAAVNYNNALADETAAVNAYIAKQDELAAAIAAVKEASRSQIEAVAGGFKKMDTESKTSFKDFKTAIESETTFMNQYNDNLSTLIAADIDDGLAAEFAQVSEEKAAILRGLFDSSGKLIKGSVDDLKAVWKARQEAMGALTDTTSAAQAAVDEEINGLKSDIATLSEEISQKDAFREAMEGNLDGMNEGVVNKKDELMALLDEVRGNIDNKFGGMTYYVTIGGVRLGNLPYPSAEPPATNAKGLDYVPYNDYLTRLHKGEAILSSVEAEKYRAGEMATSAPAIDYDRLASAVAASLSGMAVQMDGQTVGNLVTATVSRNIERQAYEARFRR